MAGTTSDHHAVFIEQRPSHHVLQCHAETRPDIHIGCRRGELVAQTQLFECRRGRLRCHLLSSTDDAAAKEVPFEMDAAGEACSEQSSDRRFSGRHGACNEVDNRSVRRSYPVSLVVHGIRCQHYPLSLHWGLHVDGNGLDVKRVIAFTASGSLRENASAVR